MFIATASVSQLAAPRTIILSDSLRLSPIMNIYIFLHPIFRYGFGLPACRAYSEYLGGSLTLESMQGIGTDVYLRLRHIDRASTSFRI